jgi:hypothetical protein
MADPLLHCPTGRNLALEVNFDGGFTVREEHILAQGQYLGGALWTDQQQRRQAVYQRLFAERSRYSDRHVLLGWTKPINLPLAITPGARTVGSALLAIPLEFEHTPVHSQVRVPSAFIPFRRVFDDVLGEPQMEGQLAIDMHMRFQIPSSILPVKVEHARLFAKVNAPSRRFAVFGRAPGEFPSEHGQRVELRSVESPMDPIVLDIVQANALQLDERGGLYLDFSISEVIQSPEGMRPANEDPDLHWTIHSLELEILGETLDEK